MAVAKRAARSRTAASRRTFQVINPATGKPLATHSIATSAEVLAKVQKARDAFRSWSRLAPKERGAYLSHAAEILRKHKESYARTMTLEMGKIIRDAIAEVEKCAWAADYFAQNGPDFLRPETVQTEASRSYIAFHPRGVLGSIMPWNFPMWQIARFAIPALIAGNTAVVKPASASPQSGLNLEDAFHEAGLPDGVFQIVVGDRTTATATSPPRARSAGDSSTADNPASLRSASSSWTPSRTSSWRSSRRTSGGCASAIRSIPRPTSGRCSARRSGTRSRRRCAMRSARARRSTSAGSGCGGTDGTSNRPC